MHSKARIFDNGTHILDGATGTALIAAGMPRACCQEKWILENPQTLIGIQRRYAEAGSEIIYAPTFQANPLALGRYGLENEVRTINARLIELSRRAAPDCVTAGNLTTLRGYIDTSDEQNYQQMLDVYSEQLLAFSECGVDVIAAETLLHPLEAKAILQAARGAGIPGAMISFALKADGTIRSGHDASIVFQELEEAGASAIGMNCIAADHSLPLIVKKLKESISIPLICKPNTGRAVNGIRPVGIDMFTGIMGLCVKNGASLIGGCCGTTPEHIAALKSITG